MKYSSKENFTLIDQVDNSVYTIIPLCCQVKPELMHALDQKITKLLKFGLSPMKSTINIKGG